ncbi:MAG TPA: TSUP family transporter [Spongiibacteraceae bacterium]|jgi:hypothetical protein
MTVEHWIVIPVLMICATVQSVFGVGVLVFGTPSLLLAGYSFTEVLSILLPCSLVISTLQVAVGFQYTKGHRLSLPLIVIPGIALGLYFVTRNMFKDEIKLIVAAMLLVTAVLRASHIAKAMLGKFIRRHQVVYSALMGFVHGLSNMGGALLAVMIASLHSEKESIRANIAYGYLIFGVTQILVMSQLDANFLRSINLFYPALCALVFAVANHLIYNRISNKRYDPVLTAVIGVYGLSLILLRLI